MSRRVSVRLWVLVAGAFLVFAIGVGAGAGSETTTNSDQAAIGTTEQTDPAPATTAPVDAAEEPEPEPEPRVRERRAASGTDDLKCDYLLGDFGESGDPSKAERFVAGGTLKNTGNVGIVVKVNVRWDLLGTEPARFSDTYRVKREGSKRVNVTVPALEGQIDAHQSADGECKASTTITDSFGQTPLE